LSERGEYAGEKKLWRRDFATDGKSFIGGGVSRKVLGGATG